MKALKSLDSTVLRIKSLLILIPFLGLSLLTVYIAIQYITFDTSSVQFSNASIKVLDKNKALLWEISKDNSVKTTPIKITEVPANCVNAIVSVEDRYFWNNIGIDLNGIGRLGVSIFTGGSSGGGSTITQQLIKVSNERIYNRNPVDKLNEIVEALKLNSTRSKSDILEMYLNNVFFGNLNYGIESAANDYFQKSTKDLNLAECSYIAGIPQWPGVLNPYGNITKAKEKQKIVLGSMLRDGYITEEQGKAAFEEELSFNLAPVVVKAPHFVQFLSDLIQDKQQKTPNILNFGAVTLSQSAEVYTNYDYELHKKALEISQNVINTLRDRNINNAAVVILDKENNLATMIGSTNFFDDSIDGKFNSALGFRQPGSSIIPFLYSYAFSKDKNPNTSYSDLPFQINIKRGDIDTDLIVANNNGYSSDSELLSNSFVNSLQTPSVLLTKDLGANKISEGFNEFETLLQDTRPNCTDALVMEGCEKTLLDLTYFYSTLKNNGIKTPITTIYSIKNTGGITRSILNTNSSFSNIKIGIEMAKQLMPESSNSWKVYNGDTDNYKDVYSFGYNDNYTIGVWAGNTKGDPTLNVTSSESTQIILEQITNYINSLQ
ncbi:MAG: transglycosylase domain-containing protein [Candidatus Dojkabacteria bacterium]